MWRHFAGSCIGARAATCARARRSAAIADITPPGEVLQSVDIDCQLILWKVQFFLFITLHYTIAMLPL